MILEVEGDKSGNRRRNCRNALDTQKSLKGQIKPALFIQAADLGCDREKTLTDKGFGYQKDILIRFRIGE